MTNSGQPNGAAAHVNGVPARNGGPPLRADGTFRSGAPLFTFDATKRVLSWNDAAVAATGIPAEDVVGKHCWEALCGHDEAGGIVCHAGCSFHRLLCESWPVAPPLLTIRTSSGTRRMRVPMITLEERTLFAALLLDAGEAAPVAAASEATQVPALTPRQQEVLEMLADGKQARKVAVELQLSEMTVRNHIRAILRELGCTSQLAAVAKARRLGLV